MVRLLLSFLLVSSAAVAQVSDLITPEEAVQLTLASPLRFKGKMNRSGAISNRIKACVFENRDVVVYYEYCTKPESPALSFTVLPKSGKSSINFYAESTAGDASTLRRDQYFDPLWRFGVSPALPSFKPVMTIAEHKAYSEEIKNAWGCSLIYMQPQHENPDLLANLISICNKSNPALNPEQGAAWLAAATPFWLNPDASWYDVVKALKAASDAAN